MDENKKQIDVFFCSKLKLKIWMNNLFVVEMWREIFLNQSMENVDALKQKIYFDRSNNCSTKWFLQ